MAILMGHEKENTRFFAIVEGQMAKLNYAIVEDGKTLEYVSTFVPTELRGQKIGQKIVKFALDYAKKNHFRIIPSCSFVRTYVQQHPKYKDIILS